MTKIQPRGQGGWQGPMQTWGGLEPWSPPGAPSRQGLPLRWAERSTGLPLRWAEWSTGSDARQSLLERVDPLKAPRNTCCPGSLWGRTGLPVATTCRPEYHGPVTQQASLCFPPPVGISGAAICPHRPPQTRETLAEQKDQVRTSLGKTHPPAPFPPPELPKPPTLGASLCHPGVGSRARQCLGTHTA